MTGQPTLRTERLRLRPFRPGDAGEVQRLAGDLAVAATTLRIPHPYEDGVAEAWIRSRAVAYPAEEVVFAIELRKIPTLLGSIGLKLSPDHDRAELGYWLGQPYWGRGYATEAAREVLRYAFETRGLHRVTAFCLAGNEASARVLKKLGMQREGLLREHFEKWGSWVDAEVYGLLREP